MDAHPPGSPALPLATSPIAPVIDELRDALGRGHAILQAPTGSGKSTLAPLALLAEAWLAGRRILMLQPRRAAARMIAARMAALLGESLGERVGYQIRLERRIGPASRIEVITEGILTRLIQSDPLLTGVGLIIFDEFHERSLHADLGLTLALDLIAGLRPDLRLLIMSATLDVEPLVDLLGEARLIQGEGRAYPVEIRYAERKPDPDPVTAVVTATRAAVASGPGDILAFLPGAAEIDRCVTRLSALLDDQTQILPLHGNLPTERQLQALAPGDSQHRRILICTDIAETSLTIPGISMVVDSGLTRKPRFDPRSGLTRLVTEPCPRASADQRAGRAGRLGPGICWRLWTRAQEQGRAEHRTPEILQSDLAALALEAKLWGAAGPSALSWVDPPPSAAWEQAIVLLTRLGALDARGNISPLGRRMAELPVHPRLAALLLGAAEAARDTAADLCALLSERDPVLDTPGQARPADLGVRLQGLHDWRERGNTQWLDPRRLAALDRVARQLRRLTRGTPSGSARSAPELLALAYPERIAQRREGADDRYRLAGGSGAVLPLDDALAIHPYLVVARLDAAGSNARIQLALPINESALRECCAARLQIGRELFWDEARESVAARLSERLESITLRSQAVPLEPGDPVTGLLLDRIRARPEQALDWTAAALQLCARVELMRRLDPDAGWPDLSLETLRSGAGDWLTPYLSGLSRLAQTRQLDLAKILGARLDWGQRQRLDAEAPISLQTPAGKARRIDYCAGDTPVLAVQLQELFGLAETPRIVRGRVPLLLHLLSPARRPIQVTQDLAGFWSRGYAEVRKELRGRYPKHAWPDDPTRAVPVAGPRRGTR